MILVVFDVLGTPITVRMNMEELEDLVVNAHRNPTRPRYPYVWKRIEHATAAELKDVKSVRINDDEDPEIRKAKEAKKGEKFDKVVTALEADKAKTRKKIADAIKAKKPDKGVL